MVNYEYKEVNTTKREERESFNVMIPGVAASLGFIFFAILILLVGLSEFLEAGEPWIVGEMIELNLISVYLLFALKIADQWEKAVLEVEDCR